MASVAVRRGIRVFASYGLATLATYVLAAVAATQWMLASLTEGSGGATAPSALLATLQDLWGLLPSFGPIVALAMGIGLLVASGLTWFAPALRGVGLVAAGTVAMIGVQVALHQLPGFIPGARAGGAGATLAQGIAGGVGGYIYYLLRRT